MPIRRSTAPSRHSRIGQERWLVSYADFITLLFGFFVVLYSVSQVNENKYRQLSRTLSQAFHPTAAEKIEPEKEIVSSQSPPQSLDNPQAFAKQLQTNLAPWVNEHRASVESNGEWVEIDLNANWLFASGSAIPSDKAQPLLKALVAELAGVDADISVFGHTDNQPIKTSQFANNWALSAARAVAVVDMLTAASINPGRLSAVGYGEFRPLVSNDAEEGRSRNRRVVLRLTKPTVNTAIAKVNSDAVANPHEVMVDNAIIVPLKLEGGGLLFTQDQMPR